MLSVNEAKTRIVQSLEPVSAESCALNMAHNRVLAEPVRANLTQPPFPMSAMDGYAIPKSALEKPGMSLPLAGTVAAGARPAESYPTDHAIRIFTGAVVPDGFAAVVAQEDTEANDGHVTINIAAPSGQHIRAKGQDFTLGDAMLTPGKRLTARDIGLLSAMNATWVKTYRRPVIGLLATGDEILMPGEPIRDAAIIGSSGPALEAAIISWGCEVRNLGVVPDNLEALKTAISNAKGVDLLVTTGGVSVGTHDLIRALMLDGMAEDDDQLDFWRIAMRPGKPLLWGRLGNLPLLGLPGNPVSSLVCSLLFLYPAIQKLRGINVMPLPIRSATLTTNLPANGPREHYLRAALTPQADGSILATPAKSQDSSLMSVLSASDGLIIQQAHQEALPAGCVIKALSFADIHGF